jgi:cell wall-associated NlpC family hydrolase
MSLYLNRKIKFSLIFFLIASFSTAAFSEEDVEQAGLAEQALKFIGIRYRWGGSSPQTGFDCSGLVRYVAKKYDIDIPRRSRDMYSSLQSVSQENMLPGDLVFFNTSGSAFHVGIYIGNREFIHSPHKGKLVSIESLDSSYYSKRLIGVRRLPLVYVQ